MRINRIKAIVMRHIYEARHNIDRISEIIYWPVLDIVIWGFFSIYISKQGNLKPGVMNLFLGAVVLWGAFYSFQRDAALGFLDEFWSRNLINIFASPLTVPEYLTGLIAVNFAKMLAGFAASVGLVWLIYSFNIFPFSLLILPFFFNLLFFGLAIGFFTTALIFRYSTKIQAFAWSFAGLLTPVSCVFYPLSTLPSFLRPVALLLPTTHSFEGMRQALAGGGVSFSHFWWGFLLSLLYFIFAILFFKKMLEIVRKRGLLVKFE